MTQCFAKCPFRSRELKGPRVLKLKHLRAEHTRHLQVRQLAAQLITLRRQSLDDVTPGRVAGWAAADAGRL
jgi:hypothetical protein